MPASAGVGGRSCVTARRDVRGRPGADPVARMTKLIAVLGPQPPVRTPRCARNRRTVPFPASLPPAQSASSACPGGAERRALGAPCSMSLRSMDRPSLLRRAVSAMLVALVVGSCRDSTDSLRRIARNGTRANHAICTCNMCVNKIRSCVRENRARRCARCARCCANAAHRAPRRMQMRCAARASRHLPDAGAQHVRAMRGGGEEDGMRRRCVTPGTAPRAAMQRGAVVAFSRGVRAARPGAARGPCRRRAGGSAGCPRPAPAHAPPSR